MMCERGLDAACPGQPLVRAFDLAAVDHGAARLLDPAEQARAAAFVDRAARQDFIAGRIVQRSMAAELLGSAPQSLVAAYSCPDCGPNPSPSHGRPGYLLHGVRAELSVSFSRSHGWAVAAMVPAMGLPLGVDVQHIASVGFAGFDEVALSRSEKLRLAEVAPKAQDAWRAAAWARKEALVKYSGLGLRMDPAGIPAFPERGLPGHACAEPGAAVRLCDVVPAEVGLPEGFAAAVAFGAVELGQGAAGPQGGHQW